MITRPVISVANVVDAYMQRGIGHAGEPDVVVLGIRESRAQFVALRFERRHTLLLLRDVTRAALLTGQDGHDAHEHEGRGEARHAQRPPVR